MNPSLSHSPLTRLSAILLALGLLLYITPYYGIRHDSILYFGEALRHLKPESLDHDLFFAFGSQADFTIFPQLLAALLQHFPAGDLFLTLTLAGRLFFSLASFILIRQLLPGGYRFWALLAIMIMPATYAGRSVFCYAEPFLTGRTFAEPLILIALAACLSRRWAWAAAAWLLAAMLHPLQALPALLVICVYLVSLDRRWLHLLWLTAFLPVLYLFDKGSSTAIFARFDDQWLTWLSDPANYLYMHNWRLDDWCRLSTDLFLLVLAMKNLEGRPKLLARSLLISALILFPASLALADLLHFIIPTRLQLWRLDWILHWFAMATIPWQMFRLYKTEEDDRQRFIIFIAIVILGTAVVPLDSVVIGTAPSVLLLIPLFALWPVIRQKIRPVLARTLLVAIVLAIGLAYLKFSLAVFHRFAQFGSNREIMRPELLLLSYPLAAIAILSLVTWLWFRAGTRIRATLFIMLCAWTAYSAAIWDWRSVAARHLEAAQGVQPSPFGVPLSSGAQVFWAEDNLTNELLAPWLMLETPSYFSIYQMSGLVYNRRTAEEGFSRKKILDEFHSQILFCNTINPVKQSASNCIPDQAVIRQSCQQAEGKLTYIVMPFEEETRILGTWTITLDRAGRYSRTYYLYQCSDFLASPSTDDENRGR